MVGPEVHKASISIIVNANAGPGHSAAFCKHLEDVFAAQSQTPSILKADHGTDLSGLARRQVRAGSQIVVAAGGDGTVNAVASALVGTEAALGVIPVGTLNHFAKDLGIPLDLESAVLNITRGRIAVIDVGEVNDRFFLNNSSLGLYPNMVLRRQQLQRAGRAKWLAFVAAGFEVLRRYPFMGVRVTAEGRKLSGKTPFVFIGNNVYEVEGVNLGRRYRLDNGTLGLYMARGKTSRVGLLGLVLRSITGHLRHARDFESMCAKEIRIETRRRHLMIAIDGEVALLSTPLHYRSRAGALRVIVPALDT